MVASYFLIAANFLSADHSGGRAALNGSATCAASAQHEHNTCRRTAAAALRHGRRAFGRQSRPQWLGVVRSRSREGAEQRNTQPRAQSAEY